MPQYTITVKTPLGDKTFGMSTGLSPQGAKAEFERQQKLTRNLRNDEGEIVGEEAYFPAGEVTVSTDEPGPKPAALLQATNSL